MNHQPWMSLTRNVERRNSGLEEEHVVYPGWAVCVADG